MRAIRTSYISIWKKWSIFVNLHHITHKNTRVIQRFFKKTFLSGVFISECIKPFCVNMNEGGGDCGLYCWSIQCERWRAWWVVAYMTDCWLWESFTVSRNKQLMTLWPLHALIQPVQKENRESPSVSELNWLILFIHTLWINSKLLE